VVLEVDGDRLAALGPGGEDPPAGARRLAGLTLPGLANAHSHAFHRLLRGRVQRGAGSFWTWRESMYSIAGGLDPDGYLAIARATFAEMALAGITLVGEFHYLHHGPGGVPYADPNAMGLAVIEAARQAGVRLTLLDTCYLHGGFGQPLNGPQQRFGDGDAERWAERAGLLPSDPGTRIGAAVHSVRAVDPDAMVTVREWASARPAPLHAHVSEQRAENEQCQATYGRSPTQLLADQGLLDCRFTAVHATHLTGNDVVLYGNRRCTCCFCPTTERDLADGIGPSVALRDAGARLALGSDSHAVIDLFEEARAVELDERLARLVRGNHDAPALLTMASANGYDCLGWPEGGRLEAGALADFTTVSLDTPRGAGATAATALDLAVFAAGAADVHHVVVGGEVVVCDGRHARLDVTAELRSVLT
jgi:formiminoglutamate deiminase